GHELPDQRREIGHVGDGVGLTGGQRVGSGDQVAVKLRLGQREIGVEGVHARALGAESVAAKRVMAYPAAMGILKKIAVGLLVAIVILAAAGWWVLRGEPAEYTVAEVTGTDPLLAGPDPQTIPTVQVAEPIGWADGAAPDAAEGL